MKTLAELRGGAYFARKQPGKYTAMRMVWPDEEL